MMQKKKMLEIKDLHTYYGSIHALKGISLEVNENEIVTLIGSNGAGKSTTLSSITGIVPAATGSIILKERNIKNEAVRYHKAWYRSVSGRKRSIRRLKR